MYWSIDTGELGAAGCDAKDLRKVLEAQVAHHAITAPASAAREIGHRMAEVLKKDPGAAASVGAAANTASDAIKAKLPAVQATMKVAIDAACEIAKQMGGKVTVSVTGHHVPDRSDGVFKRVAVLVDRAAPTEE